LSFRTVHRMTISKFTVRTTFTISAASTVDIWEYAVVPKVKITSSKQFWPVIGGMGFTWRCFFPQSSRLEINFFMHPSQEGNGRRLWKRNNEGAGPLVRRLSSVA
jgi:hypothetical protein